MKLFLSKLGHMHKPAFFIFKSVLARERSTAPYTRSLGTSQGDRNPFRNARRTNAIGHRLGIQSVSKYFLGLDEEFHMWGAPHNSGITTWSVSGTNLWVPDAELACFGRQTMNYQAYFNPWYTHVKLSIITVSFGWLRSIHGPHCLFMVPSSRGYFVWRSAATGGTFREILLVWGSAATAGGALVTYCSHLSR